MHTRSTYVMIASVTAKNSTLRPKRAQGLAVHHSLRLHALSLPSRQVISGCIFQPAPIYWLGLTALLLGLVTSNAPAAADPEAFTAKRHWAFEPVKKVEPPKRG